MIKLEIVKQTDAGRVVVEGEKQFACREEAQERVIELNRATGLGWRAPYWLRPVGGGNAWRPSHEETKREPPPGSWAATARMMAEAFPDDGFDWDAWKDQMKEGC